MRKCNYLILFTVVLFFLSSCATKVFTTSELQGNYLANMTGKKDLEMKDAVSIFMSEKEIQSDYDVLSINRYQPWHIPILSPSDKKIRKRLLERAVKNATNQKGDGVLIVDDTHYKVVRIKR